jgi:type I restriction-modification system DNA methylase subunit
MLTVAEEALQQLAKEHGKQVATHLYGQEINAETYAIAKADLLLTGEGEAADNLVGGPEHSAVGLGILSWRQSRDMKDSIAVAKESHLYGQ